MSGAPDSAERPDGAQPAGGRADPAGQDSGPAGQDSGSGLTGHDAEGVARLRRFTAEHGDSVAVVEHLGRVGARIVAIAPDGEFGDVMASSVAAARRVCEAAGVPVRDWDRELTARVTPTPADRIRMGGRTH